MSLGRYSQKWGIRKKVNLVSPTLKKYLASKIFHQTFSSLQTAIGTRPFSLIPQISSCELFQINLKYQNTSQYIHQFYSLQWIKLNKSWQNKLIGTVYSELNWTIVDRTNWSSYQSIWSSSSWKFLWSSAATSLWWKHVWSTTSCSVWWKLLWQCSTTTVPVCSSAVPSSASL